MDDDASALEFALAGADPSIILAPIESEPYFRSPLLLAYWLGAERCLAKLLEMSKAAGQDISSIRDQDGNGLDWYADHFGDGARMSLTLQRIRAATAQARFVDAVKGASDAPVSEPPTEKRPKGADL
ncbi:MAG: hypothetical protein O9327_03190 [Polaromonas sp.]|nr:hypothetical protein [Polaromonas sp.]